jgi:hypothetical protein
MERWKEIKEERVKGRQIKERKKKSGVMTYQNKHDETANDSASSSRFARSFAVAAGSI